MASTRDEASGSRTAPGQDPAACLIPHSDAVMAASGDACGFGLLVSFVIPTLNHYDLLLATLASIRAQTSAGWEVVVVDNGSASEEKERLRLSGWLGAPCFQLIQLDRNTGFAPAVNEGIRAARAPWVVVLNNDLLLAPDWLEAVQAAMSAHPDWLHAATKIRQYHQPDLFDDAGNALLPTGRSVKLGYAERDEGQYDVPGHGACILSACGAAAVYRRAFFETVGLFDEDFFAYLEDVDLGLRAQRMGHPCGWIPEAVSRHIGSATTGSMKNTFTVRLLARNQVSLLVKNLPGSLWLLLGLPIACTMAAQWLKYALARNGNGKAYAAGLCEGLRAMGVMNGKRKAARGAWTQSGLALLRQMRAGARAYRLSKRRRIRTGS